MMNGNFVDDRDLPSIADKITNMLIEEDLSLAEAIGILELVKVDIISDTTYENE